VAAAPVGNDRSLDGRLTAGCATQICGALVDCQSGFRSLRRGFILVFAALGKRRPEVRTQRERRHAQLRGGLLDREVLVESGDPGVTVEGHGWRNVSLAFRPSCPTVSLPVYQPERDGISVSLPDIDRVDLSEAVVAHDQKGPGRYQPTGFFRQ